MKPITGIIAARGGSTRIPRKNVMDFCGRPLLAWTMIQTRAVPGIGKIYLTTDDEEIADVGREYGATIHMREDSDESTDTTPGSYPVWAVIQRYGLIDHAIVPFLATSPLRCPEDITEMMRIFYKHDEKYQSLGLISNNSITLSRRMENDEMMPFFSYFADRYNKNKGDLGFLNHTGTFISMAPAAIYEWETYRIDTMGDSKDWTGETHWDHLPHHRNWQIRYFLMKGWQVYDIDTPEDIELAEYFFEKKGLREYWNNKWKELNG